MERNNNKRGIQLDEAVAIGQNAKLFVQLMQDGHTQEDAIKEIMKNVKTTDVGPIHQAHYSTATIESSIGGKGQ